MKTQKSQKHEGVYKIFGKKSISYGINYTHPQTGQRIRKVLPAATSEAQAYEIRCIEIADAKRGAVQKAYGIRDKGKPVLFEDMTDAYLKWAAGCKVSWKTDQHRSVPLLEAFRGKLLSDITPFAVETYKAARARTADQKTVNKELSLASQVYEKARGWGSYDGENPFRAVERFKIRKGKKPGALTLEEVLAIREQIRHPVKRDMVAFAFYAGWRISEIRGLRWEDVSPEAGTAWIVNPKNGQTVEIELSEAAMEIVQRQPKSGPCVFCHLNGAPFKTNLHAAIRNAAERAGVELPPRKAWHIFRRTWASNMLQSGCDVETLRELGNWKDHSMPLWYAEAAGRKARHIALNRIPKLQENASSGRNLAEMEKA